MDLTSHTRLMSLGIPMDPSLPSRFVTNNHSNRLVALVYNPISRKVHAMRPHADSSTPSYTANVPVRPLMTRNQ